MNGPEAAASIEGGDYSLDRNGGTRKQIALQVRDLMKRTINSYGEDVALKVEEHLLEGVARGARKIVSSSGELGLSMDDNRRWMGLAAMADKLDLIGGELPRFAATVAAAKRNANKTIADARKGVEDVFVQMKTETEDGLANANTEDAGDSSDFLDDSFVSVENILETSSLAEMMGSGRNGKIVVGDIGDPQSREGKELAKRFADVAGVPLPYAGSLPEAGVIRAGILNRWPWAEHAAEQIETQIAVMRRARTNNIKLRPMLFVGAKGCGKTSIARWVLSELGLFHTLVSCGGVNDSGGLNAVARGWSTARPSAIALAVLQYKVANPAFILDEIEKSTGIGGHNGSVQGALLSTLMVADYSDTCLMSKIDTTSMTFIATANDLKTIDENLLDRFQVIRFESPGREHVSTLLRNARADYAVDNELDPDDVPMISHAQKSVLERWLSMNNSARAFRQAYDVIVNGLIRDEEVEAALARHVLH